MQLFGERIGGSKKKKETRLFFTGEVVKREQKKNSLNVKSKEAVSVRGGIVSSEHQDVMQEKNKDRKRQEKGSTSWASILSSFFFGLRLCLCSLNFFFFFRVSGSFRFRLYYLREQHQRILAGAQTAQKRGCELAIAIRADGALYAVTPQPEKVYRVLSSRGRQGVEYEDE